MKPEIESNSTPETNKLTDLGSKFIDKLPFEKLSSVQVVFLFLLVFVTVIMAIMFAAGKVNVWAFLFVIAYDLYTINGFYKLATAKRGRRRK